MIKLLFDMNILWTSSSLKSEIAEIELTKDFTTVDLINWLIELNPVIGTKMKSRGLQWMEKDVWLWFLNLIEKAIARRSGVVFVARKRINFVEDRLVLKLNSRSRI